MMPAILPWAVYMGENGISYTSDSLFLYIVFHSRLKPIFDIPLHIPTQTIVATGGGTHLLAPLRDGSLAVIGIMQPIAYKKHAVMMV